MAVHMPASLWRRVERHYGATRIHVQLPFLQAWSSRSRHMTGLTRLASWELRWKLSKCLFRRDFVHGEFFIEAGVGARYQISSSVALAASLHWQHISNAQTHLPNVGIDTIGFMLAIETP